MDGLILTIIGSSVTVAGTIAGGFWKLSSRVSDQSKSIGKLEGTVESLEERLNGWERRFGSFDERVGRLDSRLNGFLDHLFNRGQPKADK